MFWKKKNNPTNNDAAKKHEFILQIATLQWMLLVTARISKAYDTQKNKRQKILTYMYYEGLAGTLIGDDTEEQRARISLAREACLELFESKGDEQYLVSRESTQNSLGKDHRIHAEVEAFLSQHKMFANAAIDKIEKFLAVFVIGAKSEKDLDQIKTQLHDLVLDEELENVLQLEEAMSSAASDQEGRGQEKPARSSGPWEKKQATEVPDESEKRTFLLEQTLGQQIKNVTAFAEKIDDAYVIRFQVIVYYYCSFLLAAFLKIDDSEIVQVRARAYVSKLTGMQPITIEVFDAYIRESPVFARTANELIAISVNNIFSDDFSGNEIPNHLVGIVEKLIFANLDNLLISCQYCGNEWKFEDVNVRSETTLYCMDDYLTNEETGLQVNACLCFKCRRVTEFAADPLNESGLAENGIEYFRTKPLTLQLLFDFHQNAQQHGNEVAKAKMDKLVQNQA